MFKIILFSICLAWTSIAYSQKIYFDNDWNETSQELASYYRLVDTLNDNKFLVKDYYLTDTMQMLGVFTSLNPEIKEGLCTWFYDNGKPKNEYEYVNGKRHGKHTSWFYNGMIEKTGFYQEWKKDGRWEYYYSNGMLMTKCTYIKGKLEGIRTHVSPDSTVDITLYHNDRFNGYSEVTDRYGKLKMKIKLDDSLENGYLYFNQNDGDRLIRGDLKLIEGKMSGELKTYSQDGVLLFEGLVKEDYKFGPWRIYNESGELVSETIHYKKNKERFVIPLISNMK